jgi:hypothetical protein
MIEKFPALQHNQAALLRAERATGHVLDEDLKLAISEHQKVFTVFNDLPAAIAAAQKIITANADIECMIQDKEEVVLEVLTIENIHNTNNKG